ncbi:hypothetical protein [Lacticaseibacillus parakribbianus]|uniref:hypothetical protein n=1 Tax=Lacticaseibacillus parakribbianus TaxID=2970927 RepID=UPI0021CB4A43|nr:hypothetical protein [Lacticaseibacillus parakribbianus]
MKTNSVGIAYVTFADRDGRGKARPVLIFDALGQPRAFKITSQYQRKSPQIRAKYFAITDWQGAGLRKPSWIDLNNILNPADLPNFTPIGHLQPVDVRRLLAFLTALEA